jgi:3-oxoacyl-[acyl-carrier-protein] synthase-3
MKAFIKAISYYLPPQTYTNENYYKEFSDIEMNGRLDKIGVNERHIVANDTTASDIGIKAAEALFKDHSIDPKSIDFILFCALEFDYIFPASSIIIHQKLNLPPTCGTMDLAVGCSGYPYALSITKGLIESSGFKNILIITSSTITKNIHPKDKGSRYIFGDASAATLISSRSKGTGIGQFIFGTESNLYDSIIVKDGGARNPLTRSSYIDYNDEQGGITNHAHLFMDGYTVFNFGIKVVPNMIDDLLVKSNLSKEDIDIYIFHQANVFLIESICKKSDIPINKVFNYMDKVGNTVSASIPIALCESQKQGKVKVGSKVLLAAFGVGLSWSSTIIEL